MTIQLGIVMDSIAQIHFHKDSTLALLWEAQARGWQLHYFEQKDLLLCNSIAYGIDRTLLVSKDSSCWFKLSSSTHKISLGDLDILLIRKDPPYNVSYLYMTYLLEYAEQAGVLVVNKPQALRDVNEKVFSTTFPHCCPPTLVTQSIQELQAFWQNYRNIICKPLNGMGGQSIFHIQETDPNAMAIFESLTQEETLPIMAQQFIPAIREGDKRVILIQGQPCSHALARIPASTDWRGNLAKGARAQIQPLSKRDYFICEQVGPMLSKRGLYFVGLDIIGDYLTEINITSPTGIRELDAALKTNLSGQLFDHLEDMLSASALKYDAN